MDDYQIALLFSVLVFVPLACLKITGIVKKPQKMSSRGKSKNEELMLNKTNLSSFLRMPQINQRREAMPDVKLNSGSDDVGMKFKIIGISLTFGLNAIVFIWYFFFSGLT